MTGSRTGIDASIVPILFGTDRSSDRRAPGGYGADRAGRLNLGLAKVSVPPNHEPGEVERPFSFLVLKLPENAEDHFVLVERPQRLSEEQFIKAAQNEEQGRALLFVHGYNSSFGNGLYRTAQLAYDLNFDGPVFMYSWPSKGGLFDYDYDGDSVRQSVPYFREFVSLVLERANVTQLSIIAHSRGNDLLIHALADLPAPTSPRLEQMIMASPDIDAEIARRLIPRLVPHFRGVTLYANDSDVALVASDAIHSLTNRLGQLTNGVPEILPHVDSIDATAARFDWSGMNHNTYVFDPVVRADLTSLIRDGVRPPDRRSPSMVRTSTRSGVFWRLTRPR